MNIVVLDGYTLNPGDLSWLPLQALGQCAIYDRTPPELTVERAAEAEIILTNKTIITRHIINQLHFLQYIGVLATGINVVDIQAAHERLIPVTNVPGYGSPSVAQLVFALLLELTRQVGFHAQGVRQGRWSAQPDFCYWDTPMIALEELTMGVIGVGQIGQAVVKLAQAFGMPVLACRRHPQYDLTGVEWTDIDSVFRYSDVVSLHCPLTADTQQLANVRRLGFMKPTAFLINTARGGLIDEIALAEVLHNHKIAGAGLDVLSIEPPPFNHPLLNAPRCFITPHVGWATRTARQTLLNIAVANVQGFLRGRLQNVVN